MPRTAASDTPEVHHVGLPKVACAPLLVVRHLVVYWRDPNETEWPQRGWINIGLISNHDFAL
ncbi:MAG: hypothetical protein M3082_13030 [Candidatus Dormibacteraeota bacterium]|nr:hypothetical protein [Candidatus Dormibacteraeota bacterium]